MKYMKYLLPLFLFAAASCSEDNTTEDPTLSAQRNALQSSDDTGIYRAGEALMTFDKEKQQLVATPSKLTFRIQDDEGTKYVSLRLESMPTDTQAVRGIFSDNMGLSLGSIDDFVLLKSNAEYFWFWSDKTRTGFVYPRIGM